MSPKPLYQSLCDLLDFAETLQAQLSTNSTYQRQYVMSLVYIENILDSYGRVDLARDAAAHGVRETEITQLLHRANSCLDSVRHQLRSLVQTQDYELVIQATANQLVAGWRKWPDAEYQASQAA